MRRTAQRRGGAPGATEFTARFIVRRRVATQPGFRSRARRTRVLALMLLSATASMSHAGVTTTGQVSPQLPDSNTYFAGGLLVVGDDAPGSLTAVAGGDVGAAGVVIGRQPTGDGDVLLAGASATLDSTGDLVIGDRGPGRLRVFDTARVTTGGAADLLVAAEPGSTGQLDVAGGASVDVGSAFVINRFVDDGNDTVLTLDNAARLRVGTAVPTADAWLNRGGTQPLHALLAGTGTRFGVNGTLHIAGTALATLEAFDGAHLQLDALRLGTGSHGTLRLDDATANAHTVELAVDPAARATLDLQTDSRLVVDAGGVDFGPGRVDADLRGELTSIGPVRLDGATPTPGKRVTVHAGGRLHSFAWVSVGGPNAHDRATLDLRGGTVETTGFLSVDRGGVFAGHGTVTLGDTLSVAGTVATGSGILEVGAVNTARFLGGTLDATWNVTIDPPAPDPAAQPVITHGTLRFDTDARLDGTLVLRRGTDPFASPPLDPPMYTPWTLVDTADDTHRLIGRFDEVLGLRLDASTAWAVTYDTQAVTAQRALRGDVTLDQHVDQHDLNAVLMNWGRADAAWTLGDVTGDGTVSQPDLNAVLSQWGGATAPASAWASVPEPGVAGGLALLASTLRRRCH